jgi:hypothetical protein
MSQSVITFLDLYYCMVVWTDEGYDGCQCPIADAFWRICGLQQMPHGWPAMTAVAFLGVSPLLSPHLNQQQPKRALAYKYVTQLQTLAPKQPT